MRNRLKIAAAALALVAAHGWAQQYPVKPVRIIVPFAPGGSADTLGRLVAGKLTESLGQNFVAENRPGAGGLVGSEIASNSAPDGYTLVVSGVASHAIAPSLASKPPFDPVRDFTHIALFGGPPAVFGVHPSMPVKDLKGFVAFAKARPGQLSYGSPGNGTQGHLVAELFTQTTGLKLIHVPYKGAALAMVDIVAGHIHAISTTLTTASGQIKAGRVRGLALSSEERLSEYSGIPTFKQAGYPEIVATVWFSLSGPAGVPADVVNRLNSEVRRILQLPEVRERLSRDGISPNSLDPKAFTGYVAAEVKRWAPVIKASGARVN
jgi:tripartite-type tricarboxylate transporter receptor subunit TctC